MKEKCFSARGRNTVNDSVNIKTARCRRFSIFPSLGHPVKENIEKQTKKNSSNSTYEAAIVVCKTLNVLCI